MREVERGYPRAKNGEKTALWRGVSKGRKSADCPTDFTCRNKSRGCTASPTRFTSDGKADR